MTETATQSQTPAHPQAALLGALDAGPSESVEANIPSGTGAADTAASAREEPTGGEKPDEEKAQEPPKEAEKQQTVPHGALHEARSEIKALRAKIAELEARPSLTTEQQAALNKLKDTEQATQEAEPDFLADPKGYVDTKVAAALKRLDEGEKTTKETQEQIKAQQQFQQLMSATAQAEATFVQTTPDYQQALTHIRGVRTQQLQMLYPDATQEQISQQLAREEISTAHQALSRGQNPAEFVYGLSKTYGYKPPEKPNGEAKATEQKKPADKEAARTMGSGGGGEAPDTDPGNSTPEFSSALQERFKRRRA